MKLSSAFWAAVRTSAVPAGPWGRLSVGCPTDEQPPARLGLMRRKVMVVQVGVDFGTLAETVFWITAVPVAGVTGRVAVTVSLPFGAVQSNFLLLRTSCLLICPGGSWL